MRGAEGSGTGEGGVQDEVIRRISPPFCGYVFPINCGATSWPNNLA